MVLKVKSLAGFTLAALLAACGGGAEEAPATAQKASIPTFGTDPDELCGPC